MRTTYFVVLLLGALPLLGADRPDEQDWANLKRLAVGNRVHVVRSDMKTVQGTFAEFTDSAIVIRTDKEAITVPRDEVYRVTSRAHPRRARNLLLGTAIGLGAGAAVGGLMDAGVNHESGEEHTFLALGALIGTGAGVATGAVAPSYPVLYRAPKVVRPKQAPR